MNRAEIAMRKCRTGSCARAVFILNQWTLQDNATFRNAYLAGDWTTAFQICMVLETKTVPTQMVINHLMDATEPEPATKSGT